MQYNDQLSLDVSSLSVKSRFALHGLNLGFQRYILPIFYRGLQHIAGWGGQNENVRCCELNWGNFLSGLSKHRT